MPSGPGQLHEGHVICRILLGGTGVECGASIPCNNAAVDKHLLEHWKTYGVGERGKLTCKWGGCRAKMADQASNWGQWKRHMKTVKNHLLLTFRCPVQGCSYTQRWDTLKRHVKTLHRNNPPQEGWEMSYKQRPG